MSMNEATSLAGVEKAVHFLKSILSLKTHAPESPCENIPESRPNAGKIPSRIPETGAPGTVVRMVRERSARKRHPLGAVDFGNGNVYSVCPDGWKLRTGEAVTLVGTFISNGSVIAAVEKARLDGKG